MTSGIERRAGYALPVVLGVVAVLALVFASAASALAALAASARGAMDGASFEALALGAEAEAVFHAASAPLASDGLRVGERLPAGATPFARAGLRTDGRPYVWREGAGTGLRLSLQDEAGLVNLDGSRPDALLRLFARLGLSEREARTMTDRLLDALDRDDDRRPFGAESADYRARGLPLPPAGGLASLAEVNAVMDWPETLAGARGRALGEIATANPASTGFNINTAPPGALEVVLGLSPAQVARVVAARERGPLASLAAAGLPGGDAVSGARPNGVLRFVVTDVRRGLRYTSRIAPGRAPSDPPWAASSALLSRTELHTAVPDAAPFPDPARPAPAR